MTTDYLGSIDELFSIVKDAIDIGSTAILGYIPEIRWQGVEEEDLPDTTKYWLRVSQRTVTNRQTTLRVDSRRFRTTAVCIVQFFCPKNDAKAMTNGRKLANIVANAFKSNSENLWFRNSRVVEPPPENSWVRLNVVVEYEFDEII